MLPVSMPAATHSRAIVDPLGRSVRLAKSMQNSVLPILTYLHYLLPRRLVLNIAQLHRVSDTLRWQLHNSSMVSRLAWQAMRLWRRRYGSAEVCDHVLCSAHCFDSALCWTMRSLLDDPDRGRVNLEGQQ